MVRKFGRRSSTTSSEDDVRSSLDLLDSVIGEFDDGLLSGTDSEYMVDPRRQARESPSARSGPVQPIISDKRRIISDKIDNIFSEATHEIIYADENVSRRRSPVRRVNDPLPTPPQPVPPPPPPPMPMGLTGVNGMNGGGDGEVIVYEDYDRNHQTGGRSPSVTTSSTTTTTNVKAQIHSLEARGRDIQQMKRHNLNNGSKMSGDVKDKSRSRSENPPLARNQGFSYLDQRSSRVEMPPPMPEKTKIHLKPRHTQESSNGSFDRNSSSNTQNGTPTSRGLMQRTDSNARVVLNGREFFEDPPRRGISPGPVSKRYGKKKDSSAQQGARNQKNRSAESSVSHKSNSNPYESVQSRAGAFNSSNIKPESLDRDIPRVRNTRTPRASRLENSRLQNRRSRSMGALEAEEHLLIEDPRHRGGIKHGEDHFAASQTSSRDRRGRNKRREDAKRSGSRGRSLERGLLQPPSPNHHQSDPIEQFLPRFSYPGKMPARQKSMIDLRDPMWEQQQRLMQQQQQFVQNQRRFAHHPQGLPPQLLRSATEHDIKIRNRRSIATDHPGIEDIPPLIRRQMMMQAAMAAQQQQQQQQQQQHQLQNERLMRSNSKLALHQNDPEQIVLRQLNLDAQREYLKRRGFSPSHPFISGEVPIHPELQGRLPFNVPSRTIPMRPDDYQRFKPELWLQQRNPNPVPFNDVAMLQSELELRRRREVHRQNSQRTGGGDNEPQSFNSLPWEEIVMNTPSMEAHMARTHPGKSERKTEKIPPNMTSFANDRREEDRKKKEKTTWFGAKSPKDPTPTANGKHNGHWFMREKQDHQSMPSMAEGNEEPNETVGLSRTDTNRSSFGIILRDKFKKNPNVYFPKTESKRSHSSDTREPDEDGSDTDTLIHNMSEESYEKEESNSLSGSGSGLSTHSNSKGSSATSSLSPHNSMEGSPRMFSKESLFQAKISSSQPNVTMGKKTIRNYTPQASTTMLRELENKRHKANQRAVRSVPQNEMENKSSVDQMIEDFHRNLPPPSIHGGASSISPPVQQSHEDFDDFGEVPRLAEVRPEIPPTPDTFSKRTSKHGTLNSQISNWSVARSTASFDYQPAVDGSYSSRRRSPQDQLPVLAEDDTDPSRISPRGERIPPEGASHQSSSPIDIAQLEDDQKHRPSRAKVNEIRGEDLSDLLQEPPTDEEDGFSNLRKLISEGRLTGLNEKPPSFVPPTPPTTTKPKSSAAPTNNGQKGGGPRRAKQPAPDPTPQSRSKSQPPNRQLEKQPSRKTKEAPKPPRKNVESKAKRQVSESLEDLTQMDQKRPNEVRRSPSTHETKTKYELRREETDHMAQLIADSTEKKFNFNPFKGLLKKKNYSFDFN
ncbi:serine/arginine repetitive matrix protein 1-like [Tigriopus californicus]|uniref:serine/arginine repetitive matrix protein 1-like n=1 Tax=Tigriopus californicus TaxID=6832 RepID=UPI0027DA38F9|nr:serine/arginine repetitive matrix protein 1-like [Tigriopus californicus]